MSITTEAKQEKFSIQEGAYLNKAIFRKFISELFESSDELSDASIGGTGYLDSWNKDGEPTGYGKDEHGRMFFTTPKLKIRYVCDHYEEDSESVMQIRFFERYSMDDVPIVSSYHAYSGFPNQPTNGAIRYKSFVAIVEAMKGKVSTFQRVDGKVENWTIELA